MSEREEFNKWAGSSLGIRATVQVRNCEISELDFAELAWQAATKQSEARIEKLLNEANNKGKTWLEFIHAVRQKENIVKLKRFR